MCSEWAYWENPRHKSCLGYQQAFSPYSSTLILQQLFQLWRGDWRVVESLYICMWHPADQQVPSSSWSMGKLANYRRRTNWWLFGLTNTKLHFSPNQTVTVQRQMKEAPHIKNIDMLAPIPTSCQYMGGVNLNDQLRSYFHSGQSVTKWWRHLFW